MKHHPRINNQQGASIGAVIWVIIVIVAIVWLIAGCEEKKQPILESDYVFYNRKWDQCVDSQILFTNLFISSVNNCYANFNNDKLRQFWLDSAQYYCNKNDSFYLLSHKYLDSIKLSK